MATQQAICYNTLLPYLLMTKYEFAPSPTLDRIITKYSSLFNEELILIESITQWSNPNRFAELVRMVHGRSVEFQSPSTHPLTVNDYLYDWYDGLQIYGVGGTTEALTEGVMINPEHTMISPVDPNNHADQLESILQIQHIDELGQLQLSQRPYAPLHGMDEGEAKKRRIMTEKFERSLSNFKATGGTSNIKVPSFASEGIFPNIHDHENHPLWFQVYRVPLVPRFPTQLIQQSSFSDVKTACSNFSYLIGRTLRWTFHLNNLAYMDGHVGNMSLLSCNQKHKLYITDLGSIHDFSDEKFPDRYKGIDFHMFYHSMDILLAHYENLLCTYTSSNTNAQEIVELLRKRSRISFMSGYLSTGVSKKKTGNSEIIHYGNLLYTAYAELSSQEFLEFTEKLLQAVVN